MSASAEKFENSASLVSEESIVDNSKTKLSDEAVLASCPPETKPAAETADKKNSAEKVINAKKLVDKSDVVKKSASSSADAENSEKPNVKNPASAAAQSDDLDKCKKTVKQVFTNAMVEKIKQNYCSDVTHEDAVNLLETPDNEMFGGVETSKGAEEKTVESEEKIKNSDDLSSEAVSLLVQGKRNMLVKDYESAVATLGEACEKFTSVYGDLGIECADAYMAYGQALLELWRVEDANKKNGGDTADADETANALEETADESLKDVAEEAVVKENGIVETNGVEMNDENSVENKDDPPVESKDEETEDQNDDDVVEEENHADNNGEEEVESEDEEEEEDVDNLQLAWEILELAKKIYEKNADYANLAKVHSKLGEISIASANFVYAVDDLKRSLELLEKTPSVDVRHKANIHFQLYIAHTLKCSFPEAEAELRIAKSTFESHLRDLEQKLQSADKSKLGEVDALSAEIKEIKEVITDLNSKMVESHTEKRELISAISDVIKTKHPLSEVPPASTSSSSSSDVPSSSASVSFQFSPLKSDVPVNNISHLVRKKPKVVPEELKTVEKKLEKSSTCEPLNGSGAVKNKENDAQSESTVNKSLKLGNMNQEPGSKRKADDNLEKEAKKRCS